MGVYVDNPPRWAELELSRRDVRRAARYMAIAGQLSENKITGATFRRRVSGWRPLSNGMRFVADPSEVLALIEARRAADVELFYYESGRA
jgi:hypothetical protein